MFEAPSRKDIEKLIIDKENVVDDIQPKMVLRQSKDKKTLNQPKSMLDDSYEPLSIEKKWQSEWELKNQFKPVESDKQFSIVIPPPNVTGSLHMGHALEHSIIDVIVRIKRLQGFETLWVPGTDHAGIITQLLVENELSEKGLTKEDVGRENFISKVWEWKEASGENISSQMKKLGMSCDWSRERFTMDEDYLMLYEKFL